jgi:hypothetical protein
MIDKIAKLPIGVRLIAPVFMIGLCFGISIGLYVGWIAVPQLGTVDIDNLKSPAQDDYIALVAKTYAYDQDLDLARERLGRLKDPKIADRVANLALDYSAQSNQDAAKIAALAIALGSRDDAVVFIAMTPSPPIASLVTPTSTATYVVPVLSTSTPTQTLVAISTRTPTRRPTGIIAPSTSPATRTAIPRLSHQRLLPASFANWPGGFRLDPANVSAGKQYWHLTRAIYCDITETQFGCKDTPGGPTTLPGGPGTIGVWVTLVGGKAPLILDDKPATLEDKSGDTQCQCTYSLDFPGPSIQVANYPSDKVIGAANTSVKVGFPNTHVRYFFTFQLMTR